MATIVRGERRPFGPIVNDTSGPALTLSQVGGEGRSRWKMLMNGMHLEGQWNCVEYVVLEPGGSVGEHVHLRTEEIYYIRSGRAVMTMDDERFEVGPGDLITTPIGASHAIANPFADEEMHFFVVEVFPGEGPSAKPGRIHVPDLLGPADDGLASAQVDLTPYFTGGWRELRLLDVPAGGRLDETTPAASSVVLHVLDGSANIVVDGVVHQGGAGLSAAVPPGFAWSVVNRAAAPLRLLSVEVEVES